MNVYSPHGNRKQSAITNLDNLFNSHKMLAPFRMGFIRKVFTADDPNNVVGITSGAQGFITYDVELTPDGVVVENIPAMMTGGHAINPLGVDPFYPLDLPPANIQNTEEIPFVIGQPVIVGFFNNSPLNGFILGPISSQYNNGTQTTAQYPQKTESWQGSTRTIDKNGQVTYNIVSNEKFIIQINGTPLVTVDGTNNTVDIGTGLSGDVGMQHGVLGNTLQTFLNTVFDSVLGHTHTEGTFPGTTGPPVGIVVPNVKTNVLFVQ